MVDLGGDVRALLVQAQRMAKRNGGGGAGSTGDVLLAMLDAGDDAARLLSAHGAHRLPLYEALKRIPTEAGNTVDLVLERARRIAARSGSGQARALHLLLATVQNQRSEAHRGLSELGVPVDALKQLLEDSLGVPSQARARDTAGQVQAEAERPLPRTLIDWEAQKRSQSTRGRSAKPPTESDASPAPRPARERRAELKIQRASRRAPQRPAAPDAPAPQPAPIDAPIDDPLALDPARFPLLAQLGRNLTREAAAGSIDPVVGRDDEIEQLLDILARRRANNPILVGPPGVGKTAIVEGLARRLVADAGAFGGSTQGAIDAPESRPSGSEASPALPAAPAGSAGRAGSVRALPGPPKLPRILVELSAGALVSGTSVRGALADKMARLRKEVKASEGRVLLFLDEIHALMTAGDGPDDLANELKASLARGDLPCIGATTELEYRRVFERDAALSRRFSRVDVLEPSRDASLAIVAGVAAHYERFHRVAYSREALEAAVDLSVRYLPDQHLPDKAVGLIDRAAARARRRGAEVVDHEAVAAVISEQVGVPAERLLLRDAERLLALEQELARRVIGQPEAIRRVAESVRRGAVGLRGKRPLGVFLFLGPTGVGKTELAKALSDVLFPKTGMTRLDLSEYSESHAVSRLVGAPPGYVGHEEGGQLTEAVRRRPYQLVLLDEVEKAHPDVLLALLAMLDEGRLTDGRGRTVDFSNVVVVLTSNLGVRAATREKSIGFGGAGGEGAHSRERESTLAQVRAALPPELFNRLDEVLYFPRLSRVDVGLIARRMLDGVVALLSREHAMEVQIDDSVVDALIAAGGYDPQLGARPMRRTIAREVESLLADMVLRRELSRGDQVRLSGEGGRVRVRRTRIGAA